MIPVVPYQVRRAEDGLRGQLLLRLRHGKSAYIVELPMEQARQLAVEMRGLASDHCPLHHLSLNLTQSLGAQVSHIFFRGMIRPTKCLESYVWKRQVAPWTST